MSVKVVYYGIFSKLDINISDLDVYDYYEADAARDGIKGKTDFTLSSV